MKRPAQSHGHCPKGWAIPSSTNAFLVLLLAILLLASEFGCGRLCVPSYHPLYVELPGKQTIGFPDVVRIRTAIAQIGSGLIDSAHYAVFSTLTEDTTQIVAVRLSIPLFESIVVQGEDSLVIRVDSISFAACPVSAATDSVVLQRCSSASWLYDGLRVSMPEVYFTHASWTCDVPVLTAEMRGSFAYEVYKEDLQTNEVTLLYNDNVHYVYSMQTEEASFSFREWLGCLSPPAHAGGLLSQNRRGFDLL